MLGDFYIPTQKIQFLNNEFQLDSIKIKVISVVTDTTKQGMYGIKPIMKSNTQIDYLYWFYVFGILSIIAFAIYFRKKILSLFTIQKLEVKYFTPYEKAVNELTKIDKLKYESNDDVKNYYSNLTLIVRNFIEEKIIKNALECTTKELIEKLDLLKTAKKYKFSNKTLKNIDGIFSRASS